MPDLVHVLKFTCPQIKILSESLVVKVPLSRSIACCELAKGIPFIHISDDLHTIQHGKAFPNLVGFHILSITINALYFD